MLRSSLRRYRVPALLLVGLAVVFAGDAFTPLGVSVWLLYLPLVMGSIRAEGRRAPWVVAGCATILLALSFFLKPPGISPSVALVNRGIATVALWTSAALVHRVRSAAFELARSQERLRAAQESAHQGMVLFESVRASTGRIEDFRYASVNSAAADMLGHAAAALEGRRLSEVFPHATVELEEFARVVETGQPLDKESYYKADGLDGWFRTSAVKSEDGVAVWFNDISPVKRNEQALRDSEARMRFALETSLTGAWDLDLVDHTAYRSLEHDRIFGYEQLLPAWTYDMFLEHVLPDDRERVDAAFRKATAERSDWSFECRIRRRDGDVRWIWAAGRHRDFVDGEPRRMAGIVQDITQRKQAEQDLRESEQRFRTLADNISQLAWMADSSGWIHWYNRRWYEYTGTTFEQMAGWGWQSVHHAEHLERVVARWKRSHASGEPWEDTFPLRGADGSYRWFLSRALPVRDGNGGIVGWFGTNTDVTELREAQQSLLGLTRTLEERVKRRTAELEESNAALEAFGYSVSHDLRAPLRTMQGFARALLEDYGPLLDEDGRDYATRITTGAARMDQLIQDLLAYSRLSRSEIKAEPVSLESVLRMAERQLEPALQERHGTLAIHGPLPRVLGHETTLVQVIVNLLSNALKFTAPGTAPSVEVWSERRAGRVRLFVRDNGIGIEPQHQDRIFAVFERLHGTEAYPGTGIGLAIVKKGIERLRGRSGVDSAPGQGSTFWIELPEPAAVAERSSWTYSES